MKFANTSEGNTKALRTRYSQLVLIVIHSPISRNTTRDSCLKLPVNPHLVRAWMRLKRFYLGFGLQFESRDF